MSDEIFGVAIDRLDGLARQIEAATESYAKLSPLDDFDIDWGDRLPLVWEMIRREIYPAWDDPIIWYKLSETTSLEAATTEDLVEFLSKVTVFDKEVESSGYDDYHNYDDPYFDEFGGFDDYHVEQPPFEAHRLTEFWPVDLDRMAMHAYAANPDLVEARLEDFSPDVRKGLELVRRRFGVIEIDDLPQDTVSSLAEVFVWRDLPSTVLDVNDSEVVEQYIGSHDPTNDKARADFLQNFCDAQTWQEAVLKSVFSREDQWPSFHPVSVAIPLATLDQVQTLLVNIRFYREELEKLYELLLQRDDAPADLLERARALAEVNKLDEAEILATVATLRSKEQGAEIDERSLELFRLKNLITSSRQQPPAGLTQIAAALQAFDEEAVTAHLMSAFDDRITKSAPFLFFHAFPENRTLLERGFELVPELVEGDYSSLTAMAPIISGLSLCGEALIPELVEAADNAEHPLVKATYHAAILGAVADGATHDEAHRFVSLIGLPLDLGREYEVKSTFHADYVAALKQLGDAGLELALADAKATDQDGWARVAAALKVFPTESLAEVIFDGLVAGKSLVIADHDWFREINDLYYQHKELLKPQLGRVLAAQDDPDTHNRIRSLMGDHDYQQALDEAGAQTAADTSRASKVKRLAKAYFEANPDVSRTTVYIFDRLSDEEPDPNFMNRIGGRPFGTNRESWPCKGDDSEQPMTHMMTLDLETVPGLRQGFNENVRAISLYIRSPGMNQAWQPHNSDSFVDYIAHDAEEFQGDLPTGDESAVAFSVEAVEVPTGLWTVGYNTDPPLEAVRGALYQCNAWGGGPAPIWLQGDEYHGDFILQFDEGFIYTNLGDCGIMYVFSDTAFWQCH